MKDAKALKARAGKLREGTPINWVLPEALVLLADVCDIVADSMGTDDPDKLYGAIPEKLYTEHVELRAIVTELANSASLKRLRKCPFCDEAERSPHKSTCLQVRARRFA